MFPIGIYVAQYWALTVPKIIFYQSEVNNYILYCYAVYLDKEELLFQGDVYIPVDPLSLKINRINIVTILYRKISFKHLPQ